MKKIQMVDLGTQYQRIKSDIDRAIIDVVESTAYINGPEVQKFKESIATYVGVKHAIPCANGTDALQIALMALDLAPGDEVITVDFTFAATAEVIGLLRLTPVLVDVRMDDFNIDPEKIRAAITPRTKAIIPVHLFGQCAPMEEIMAIADEHNIVVIEDNAQAIGAEYTFADGTTKKAGAIGHMSTTSFFPSKNLGCYGDGGCIFTNDEALGTRIAAIVNHGMYKRYYHDDIGVNSRLDSIQAAVLNIKLKSLDDYNKARYQAAQYYNEAFRDLNEIITPGYSPQSSHVHHQYTLRVNGIDRNALVEYLKKFDIPAMIYYPVALHNQKAYKSDKFKEEDYPITNELCKVVFSLPMHTELEQEQQDFIIEKVKEFIRK
ncbi:MAG: UDP-2-acetamido-2-deoxy-ribo-hexuluronate aminotransferase [Granulosicoccus sp.]|jgi:UDP-2-acetamido-2-deoxy-ribo-hexuluronate aminotransferase